MGDSRYIYQNKLDKTSFHYDMAYWDFKDLPRRTASDKILRDKAFNIAKNPKYCQYQRGLVASTVYNFLIKRLLLQNTKTGINSENKELAEELHKPIIKKFEKGKVHSSFIDNILGCWSSRYAATKQI